MNVKKSICIIFSYFLFQSCTFNKINECQKIEYNFNDSITKIKLKKCEISLNDEIFLMNNIETKSNIILNSNSKTKLYNPFDENWTFPFIYYDGPVDIRPLYLLKYSDFNLFLVCYSPMSTASITGDIFGITISDKGQIIDFKKIAPFVLGRGDNPTIINSNFVKKYGKAGYSEIKNTDMSWSINTSLLKVFYNGTEEIQNIFYVFNLTENGLITNFKTDSIKFIYFKNKTVDTSNLKFINRF